MSDLDDGQTRTRSASEDEDELAAAREEAAEAEELEGGDRFLPAGGEDDTASAWEAFVDDVTGDQYYFNNVTEETTWDKPPGFVPPP